MRILAIVALGFVGACGGDSLRPDWDDAAEAYLAPVDDVAQVWVMSAEGSNPRVLTTGGEKRWPKWSPDGEWIAYLGVGHVGGSHGGIDPVGFGRRASRTHLVVRRPMALRQLRRMAK